MKEKALMERTNAELSWLRQMKKRLKSRGGDERMPIVLKKKNELIEKLKDEQVLLECFSYLKKIFKAISKI